MIDPIAVFVLLLGAATPILFAALGELVVERAGVLNLGVEGMMIGGALAGFAAAHATGSPAIGFAMAALAGVLLSMVFAVLSQYLLSNQVATGLALTMFGLGLTAMFGKPYEGVKAPAMMAGPLGLNLMIWLGLAMGSASLIADLNRVKFSLNPYNINRLTLKAGQAALEDTAYFDRTRAAIVDTRAWTKQQLEQRGFAVLDSRSNFLFASTNRKDGGTLYKELKKNGILVRHFDAPRITDWLRITIGTPEQMQALMDAVDKILEV